MCESGQINCTNTHEVYPVHKNQTKDYLLTNKINPGGTYYGVQKPPKLERSSKKIL